LLRRTTRLKQNRWLAPLRWAYTGVERTLGGLGLADNLAMVLQRRDQGGLTSGVAAVIGDAKTPYGR
jgi:hypothetical protein